MATTGKGWPTPLLTDPWVMPQHMLLRRHSECMPTQPLPRVLHACMQTTTPHSNTPPQPSQASAGQPRHATCMHPGSNAHHREQERLAHQQGNAAGARRVGIGACLHINVASKAAQGRQTGQAGADEAQAGRSLRQQTKCGEAGRSNSIKPGWQAGCS